MRRLHALLAVQSLLLVLASVNRLWSATDVAVLPDDALRLVPYRLYAIDVHAGDRVSVVVLPGGVASDLPSDVQVRRLDADLSYTELLDLIFESDHVITW